MLKFRKKLAEKKEASKGIAKAGFTLIELLVVLVILGILVLLAAPRFLGYSKDAEVAAMKADVKVLENAALVYHVENEVWPGQTGYPDEEIMPLNEDDFKDSVQTLKNDFGDYALVVTDELPFEGGIVLQEGDIIFIGNDFEGVEDSKGNIHFGVDIKFPAELFEDPGTGPGSNPNSPS